MEFAIITIANLLWVIYSVFEGMRESVFRINEESSRRKINFDMDRIFKIQRLIVLSSISLFMAYIIGLYSIPFIIGQFLMFSYFKNLSYSCTFNKLKSKKVEAEIKEKEKTMILFGVIFQIVTYLILY